MRDLYTELEAEYINEDENIFTVGDDIINTFFNGNFTQGVKELIEINVSPREFGDYLMEISERLWLYKYIRVCKQLL